MPAQLHCAGAQAITGDAVQHGEAGESALAVDDVWLK
jgi:hypothetical protein